MDELDTVYASPRQIFDLEETNFYHVMELPQHGLVGGYWDLRQALPDYLGHVNFKSKRILEVGTASGFLCFYMESQGADVVAFDLSHEQSWDVVPLANLDVAQVIEVRKARIRKLNNAFWMAHRLYQSKANVVYGSVYNIPKEIGVVDIAVFSAVLLHMRDPFAALQNGLRLTREKVIITETFTLSTLILTMLTAILSRFGFRIPFVQFIPNAKRDSYDTWWQLTPGAIRAFIGVLGFEKTTISYHYKARYQGRRQLLYTIVGERTVPLGE